MIDEEGLDQEIALQIFSLIGKKYFILKRLKY
jgi:hypothetical protein